MLLTHWQIGNKSEKDFLLIATSIDPMTIKELIRDHHSHVMSQTNFHLYFFLHPKLSLLLLHIHLTYNSVARSLLNKSLA